MSAQFHSVFAQLRALLRTHADALVTARDSDTRYELEAPVGPATVRSWGGKVKRKTIPVAWVSIGRSYVSYHLMGIPGQTKLLAALSQNLRAHMQGQSCFNFKQDVNDALLKELAQVTSESLNSMRKAGFIGATPPE